MSKQEQNSRNKKLVNDLLKIPGNKVCADCNARGPQWASTTQGVFFCIRCAGLHRKLGTHISKVRSVGLDSWNDEQRRMVELFGNDKANAIFEAKLDREKPTADTDTATVEKFIRAKYERKLWIDSEAFAREYGNLDLNSEDSSPATTPTTPLKQSVSTQNFQNNRQSNLRSVSSQDDVANPPPQVKQVRQQPVKQTQPVQQSNTPSLITFEDTPKQNDLSEFIIMDNNNPTGQRQQTSSKDSVLNLFDSPLQPTSRNTQPPQQQQPFTIPGGPPPLNNGMGRGMPPPMNNGMGRGMGYPPPLNNGMGMGMNGPPPLNNGMGMNGPPMMGRGYPPQGFNNGMGMMNGPPPLNNGMGMGMGMNGPPPLNNGMGMGMNGPPPLNNGMGMNGPPPMMMGRGYPPQGYNSAMRF